MRKVRLYPVADRLMSSSPHRRCIVAVLLLDSNLVLSEGALRRHVVRAHLLVQRQASSQAMASLIGYNTTSIVNVVAMKNVGQQSSSHFDLALFLHTSRKQSQIWPDY
jgi:hypothetical protein